MLYLYFSLCDVVGGILTGFGAGFLIRFFSLEQIGLGQAMGEPPYFQLLQLY